MGIRGRCIGHAHLPSDNAVADKNRDNYEICWSKSDVKVVRPCSGRSQERSTLVHRCSREPPSRCDASARDHFELHLMRDHVLLEWAGYRIAAVWHCSSRAGGHRIKQPFLELKIALEEHRPAGPVATNARPQGLELLHCIEGVQLVSARSAGRKCSGRTKVEHGSCRARRQPVHRGSSRTLFIYSKREGHLNAPSIHKRAGIPAIGKRDSVLNFALHVCDDGLNKHLAICCIL